MLRSLRSRISVRWSQSSATKPFASSSIQSKIQTHSATDREDVQKSARFKVVPLFQSPENIASAVLKLSKARLASFVVLTTMAGYAMAPTTCSASPLALLAVTVGTGLCVASANSWNQLFEVPYDVQMQRTRTRPLPTRQVSPLFATGTACLTGLAGIGILNYFSNPVVAALGAFNIILYGGVYTQMKRRSTLNTWVGAIVGAIPPMMGWAAVTGGLEPGSWILGSILYAWQFPHFNALSWNIRDDYAKAGFQMTCLTDPGRNARVSLYHSLSLLPLCGLLSYFSVTTPCFAIASAIPNAILTWHAFQFYRDDTNDQYARKLFFASLWHLPSIIILMLIMKEKWPRKDERLKMVNATPLHSSFGVS